MRFSALAVVPLLINSAACASAASASSALTYDKQGRPVVEALVNGEAAFDFVVDTAAQTTAIGTGIIDILAIEPDPNRKAQLHGSSGAVLVDLYPIKSIRIGDVEKTDILAPAPQHENTSGADGILGADFFGGSSISFDFVANTVKIGGPVAESESIDIDLRYGVFAAAPVKIGNIRATAVIDTGARRTIGNFALMKALGVDVGELRTGVEVGGVSGQKLPSLAGYSGALSFGVANIDGAAIDFADAPVFASLGLADGPALILGMDALRRLGGFSIDYQAKALVIAPTTPK